MAKISLSKYFSEIYNDAEVPKFKVLVDGKWIDTKNGCDLISPLDGKKIAEISSANEEELKKAVSSAKANQSKIRDMAAIDRLELINSIRLELGKHVDELVNILVNESGKSINSARGEINAALERMRLSMEDSKKVYGEYLPGDWSSDTSQKMALVIREPIGVVLGVSPFNYPVYTSVAKIVPALLAGNSVVLKPPSADPVAFLMCAEIFRKCGVPSGTLQVVTCDGETAGKYLIRNDDINMISFTGSTSVGKEISQTAGLKKLHLELGGKGTAIVLEDADIELAAKECVKGSLELSGQRCDAISRILVVKKAKDALEKKLVAHLKDYTLGNPLDDNKVSMGPVINEKSAIRIDGLIKDALKHGAKLVAGGKFDRAYYEPTLLTDVPLDSRIAEEETFGPVITVITCSSEEEAISIANKSQYGLDSCVFTQNFYSAWKIMKSLQVGNVTLNAAPSHGTAYFPFGGVKNSGQGKEGVGYSLEEMTIIKTVIFNLSPAGLGKIYKGLFKD